MTGTQLRRSAIRLLESLGSAPRQIGQALEADAQALVRCDLAIASADGRLTLTEAGRLFLARKALQADHTSEIDAFRAQHLALVDAVGVGAKFDEAESPLVWLARRKGADGRPLIAPHQLQAGERLRAEFTAAQMMPRTTSNWHSPIAGRRRDGRSSDHLTERVVATRQRLRRALDAAGPEFAGLLLDVCCFLKKLEEVERERRWPARSAKVVLQLALERLARHFGYQSETRGRTGVVTRAWAAETVLSDVGDS